MKIVKRIALGILAFFGLLLLVALFIKNEYKVEQQIAINQPRERVFDYVRFARNQDQFNKWITSDPLIQKSYRGTDGTEGFVYAWESVGDAGQGEQEISRIRPNEQVDFVVRFIKPFEGAALACMKTETLAANQTKLTWTLEGQNHYPMNLLNLFVPALLGSDMSTSLHTLKEVLEKR